MSEEAILVEKERLGAFVSTHPWLLLSKNLTMHP